MAAGLEQGQSREAQLPAANPLIGLSMPAEAVGSIQYRLATSTQQLVATLTDDVNRCYEAAGCISPTIRARFNEGPVTS